MINFFSSLKLTLAGNPFAHPGDAVQQEAEECDSYKGEHGREKDLYGGGPNA
jgi:hypothetical protein